MRLCLLLSVFATCLAGQETGGDDVQALLLAVRKKVLLTIRKLPRYMCTETVDRSTLQPKTRVTKRQLRPSGLDAREPTPVRFAACDEIAKLRQKPDWRLRKESSDRLRLDVAVSADSEMFSWAGENRFQDLALAGLVRRGATSTGAFGSFLSSIFGTHAADFTYHGNVSVAGRVLTEFGFRMPLDRSTFHLENDAQQGAIVPYEGTFLVDPASFDLVRLSVVVRDIPSELGVCEDNTTLDYHSVRLDGSEFLLPSDVRLRVVNADGRELENRTVFTGCHEFLAESAVSFATPSTSAEAGPKPASKPLALPPGLPFRITLSQAIDTATAAAGDPIRATLATRIKENSLVVPKGTAVTGRIIQIIRLYQTGFDVVTLALKIETVSVNGVLEPFHARPESAVARRTTRRSFENESGWFGQMSDPADPSVGFLEFQDVGERFVINPGLEMNGVTTGP